MPLDAPVTFIVVSGAAPLWAHRPEPNEPPNPGEPTPPTEPDTVPDPTREPGEPTAPPIGDPPPQPNQTPHVCRNSAANRAASRLSFL